MNKAVICLLSILLFLISSSFFIVKEGERGILLKFGKVLRNSEKKPIVYNPGLHFKFPFLEKVKMLDARIHTIENQADRFVTKEKKDLIIDSYIKWRINDFSSYYLATGGGDVFQAEILLKKQFSDQLRSEISCLDLKEIISDSQIRLTKKVLNFLNKKVVQSDEESSTNINRTNTLGMQIIDIRIKKINLPVEMSDSIYSRMISEKKILARNKRFQGQEKAEKLRVLADYKVSLILSEAQKEALIIKGEGEAKVTKIFAEHIRKEPDFYFFLRSLRAYENSFNNDGNIIILQSDNDFFKYMHNMIKVEQ